MINDNHIAGNAKPRRAGRGFARSAFSRLVATLIYRIGTASANARLALLSLALGGARHSAALLWGGQDQ